MTPSEDALSQRQTRDRTGRRVLDVLETKAADKATFLADFPPKKLADVTAELLGSVDPRVRLRVVELLVKVYGWLDEPKSNAQQPPILVVVPALPTREEYERDRVDFDARKLAERREALEADERALAARRTSLALPAAARGASAVACS